jgi:hypothetical protein
MQLLQDLIGSEVEMWADEGREWGNDGRVSIRIVMVSYKVWRGLDQMRRRGVKKREA